MAALSFVGASSNYSTTQDEYTIRLPSAYAVGDILLLGISIRGSSMPVLDPFWKKIFESNTGNISTSTATALPGYAAYWAIYEGGTIPINATRDRPSDTTNDVHTHNVIALRGGTDPNPIGNFTTKHVTAGEAASLFTDIPPVETTTPDETLIVMGFGARNGTYRVPILNVTDPDPSAFSQIVHASSSTGADTLLAMWMANKPVAGLTGGPSIRIEHSTTSRHSGAVIAIRSAAAVVPGTEKPRRQRMVLVS